jgi:hypothetical protein
VLTYTTKEVHQNVYCIHLHFQIIEAERIEEGESLKRSMYGTISPTSLATPEDEKQSSYSFSGVPNGIVENGSLEKEKLFVIGSGIDQRNQENKSPGFEDVLLDKSRAESPIGDANNEDRRKHSVLSSNCSEQNSSQSLCLRYWTGK